MGFVNVLLKLNFIVGYLIIVLEFNGKLYIW
jgi:hypothetical protein